jgi:Ulp1 family protease
MTELVVLVVYTSAVLLLLLISSHKSFNKKIKIKKEKRKKEKEKGLTNKIKKKRKGARIFETLSQKEKKKPVIHKKEVYESREPARNNSKEVYGFSILRDEHNRF